MIGYDWLFVGFFCKQNTAYEMRMSDWSSDVCSSDLLAPLFHHLVGEGRALAEIDDRVDRARVVDLVVGDRRGVAGARARVREHLVFQRGRRHARGQQFGDAQVLVADRRSEEHTSELQSLMRISYAVFCLKQKKKKNEHE